MKTTSGLSQIEGLANIVLLFSLQLLTLLTK